MTQTATPKSDALLTEIIDILEKPDYKAQREKEFEEFKALWSTPAKITELYGDLTPPITRWYPWMMTRFHEDGFPVVPGWLNTAPDSCDGCGKCCSSMEKGRRYSIPVNVIKDPMVVPFTDHHEPLPTGHVRSNPTRAYMTMCGDSCAQLGADKKCRIYAFRPQVCREYPRGAQQCRAFCRKDPEPWGEEKQRPWSELAQMDCHFWDAVPIEHLPNALKRYPNIAFGDTEARNAFMRANPELVMTVANASEMSRPNGIKSIGDALAIVNEIPLYAIRHPGMTLNKYKEIQRRIDEKAKPADEDYNARVNIDAECYTHGVT